jgi:hypothetical protein
MYVCVSFVLSFVWGMLRPCDVKVEEEEEDRNIIFINDSFLSTRGFDCQHFSVKHSTVRLNCWGNTTAFRSRTRR